MMINWKVVIYSFLALGFLALSYLINWLFLIPVAILIWLNQKELMKPKE